HGEGSGEFVVTGGIGIGRVNGLLRESRFQFSQVVEHSLVFGAIAPNSRPVDFAVGSGSSTNDFKHPFGRVRARRQLRGTVSLKVAGKSRGLFSDITEVDSLTTLGEEQQAVETLE